MLISIESHYNLDRAQGQARASADRQPMRVHAAVLRMLQMPRTPLRADPRVFTGKAHCRDCSEPAPHHGSGSWVSLVGCVGLAFTHRGCIIDLVLTTPPLTFSTTHLFHCRGFCTSRLCPGDCALEAGTEKALHVPAVLATPARIRTL